MYKLYKTRFENAKVDHNPSSNFQITHQDDNMENLVNLAKKDYAKNSCYVIIVDSKTHKMNLYQGGYLLFEDIC